MITNDLYLYKNRLVSIDNLADAGYYIHAVGGREAYLHLRGYFAGAMQTSGPERNYFSTRQSAVYFLYRIGALKITPFF